MQDLGSEDSEVDEPSEVQSTEEKEKKNEVKDWIKSDWCFIKGIFKVIQLIQVVLNNLNMEDFETKLQAIRKITRITKTLYVDIEDD